LDSTTLRLPRFDPRFEPCSWKIASRLMSVITAKQLSVACTAGASALVLYSDTLSTVGAAKDTVTAFDA